MVCETLFIFSAGAVISDAADIERTRQRIQLIIIQNSVKSLKIFHH